MRRNNWCSSPCSSLGAESWVSDAAFLGLGWKKDDVEDETSCFIDFVFELAFGFSFFFLFDTAGAAPFSPIASPRLRTRVGCCCGFSSFDGAVERERVDSENGGGICRLLSIFASVEKEIGGAGCGFGTAPQPRFGTDGTDGCGSAGKLLLPRAGKSWMLSV